MLAEILKLLPENQPGHQQVVTHVNGCVIDRFFFLNIETLISDDSGLTIY